jgi:hypothetical protein
MSPAESKAAARRVGEFMARKRREEAEAAKQATAPSGETRPKVDVAELYRKAGFREVPYSGKGYLIIPGRRP